MKQLLLILSIFVAGVVCVFSQQQVFTTSEVNVSNFPKLYSYVSLSSGDISERSAKDFKIYENGVEYKGDLELICNSSNETPPVNLILMLDNSNSMEKVQEGASVAMKKHLIAGTRQFIDAFYFDNGSKMEIITFSNDMRQLVPFTNDREYLKKRVDSLIFGGGTNFDPPFLHKSNGAFKRFATSTPDSIRRAVVIISDVAPDGEFHWREIVEECIKLNITVYTVILNHSPQEDAGNLFRLAENTGGIAYIAKNGNDLYAVLSDAVNKQVLKKMCRLFWTTHYACDANAHSREVVFHYIPASSRVKRQYLLPQVAIIRNDYYNTRLFFDLPEIGRSTEQVLTISPRNFDVKLLSYEIKPSKNFKILDWNADEPGYQGVQDVFIAKGTTHRIKVQFSPTEEVPYVIARLKINAEPCELEVELLGGIPELRIISPEGGEKYSYCDSIIISWIGRKKDEAVALDYKTPETSNWTNIVSGYKADTIVWMPPKQNMNYQFRVRSTIPGKLEWAKVFGSSGAEFIEGFMIDKRGENIYIIGSYEDNFKIDDVLIEHTRKKDAFLLCFDEIGNLKWHKELIGPDNDEINGFCFDDEENISIVGKMTQDSELEWLFPNITNTKRYFAFTAKFNKNGELIGRFFFDPRKSNSTFASEGHAIEYNASNNEYTVYCNYSGEYMFDGVVLRKNNSGYFQFKINKNMLTPKNIAYSIKRDGRSNIYYATDVRNNSYTAAVFNGTKKISGTNYESKGATDIYITKYASSKYTSDVLEKPIAVRPVFLNLEFGDLNFGAQNTGKSITQTFNFITNNGEVPVTIDRITLSDPQFTINVPNNTVIQPNNSIPCDITFTAKRFGKTECNMTIDFACHEPISISMLGEVLCNFEAKSEIDMGNVAVNKTITKTFESVITNNELDSFFISAKIVGADSQFFKVISPAAGTMVQAGKSIPLIIEFSPQYDRTYIAYIEYTASAGCKGQITQITAKAVSGDITVNDIDFGSRRLGSTSTKCADGEEAILTITNNEGFPIELKSIELSNEAEFKAQGFELLSELPNMPLLLNANESYMLKFAFTPKSEARVSSNVIMKLNGNNKEYSASLSGEGFIPKFKYSWECPPPVNPGSNSIGEFVIDITDSKSDVFIKSIKFKKGDEYEIIGNLTDLTLSKKKNRYVYQVLFKPKSSGSIRDELIIASDAVASSEEKPLVDSVYSIECEAKGNAYDTNLEFGKTLICGQREKSIFVENKSRSTAMKIVSAKIIAEAGVFSINSKIPVSIPANQREIISISFTPKERKKYSGELYLETDDAQVLICQLLGEGDVIRLFTSPKLVEVTPGKTFQVPILSDFSATNDEKISSVSFIIKFNPAMFTLDKKKPIQTIIPGLSWKQTKLAHGRYRFDSEGDIAIPLSSNEIAKLKFFSALGDTNKDDISIQYFVDSCEVGTEMLFSLKLNPVCLDSLRRVQFSNTNTKISSIYPNPIHDELSIEYLLGIEAPVTLEICNELGNVVMTIVNERQKAGEYLIKHSLGELSSGVYYLRLRQSDIVKIQKLNVVR